MVFPWAGFYTGKDGKGYRDQYLVNGDLNWQVDRHNLIKAGFQFTQHKINVYNRQFRATPEWQNNAWPLQNELNGATMDFSDTEYTFFQDFNIEPLEAAFYLQDKIEMGDVIVNAGLRLDLFYPNERVPIRLRTESFNLGSEQNLRNATTKYQVSPRIGISFPTLLTAIFFKCRPSNSCTTNRCVASPNFNWKGEPWAMPT